MPYDRILELMAVPGSPGVYLLGTYAKRLTLYSQQIRAIDLIDAIHWYRQPWNKVRLAVVGGGAAGITAAARALQLGAHVTLFEKLQSVLEIQSKSERWLHPTLYEWPFSGLDPTEDSTQLPVMNWTATTAKEVADKLTQEWNATCARTVIPRFNSEVFKIEAVEGGSRLTWRSKIKAGEWEEAANFEHVIFAVGYGLEPKGTNRKSYWENDSLDKTLRPDECVLIAGYGDGALTDLMRACLRDFDHRELLTTVASAVKGDVLDKIKSIETDVRSSDAAYLTGEYKELSIPAVQDMLKPFLNATRHVTLTGQGPHLFNPRASALNRLVASQLLHLEAFQHCPIGEGERIESADASDPVFTRLQEETGRRFSDIVLRFGAEPTITKIQGLRSTERLRKAWDRIHPKLDPSRVRLWDRFTPISEDIEHSAVLFLSPSSDEDFLQEIVQRAVADARSPQVRDLRTVRLTNCFNSDEALFHTVRALCRSPVVIFALGTNMGRQNVGGMLLMGIRAAVRRGATVVVHEGRLAAADWSSLPFNLKELQIYGLRKDEWLKSAALVGAAIREGLAVLSSDAPGYRDMPVFDIVRRPIRRTERPAGSEREVFVLCSFDKSYDQSWQKLQLWLDGKEDGTGGRLSLKRVIDYVSPLLAGERLYELTRHAGTCLIDWTGWSPNVFFELGVRLAVSSTHPVCLLQHEEVVPDKTAEQLLPLFQPLRYQRPGESGESFRARFLERFGNLQPDPETVYSVVERNLALQDEYGGRPLHEQLFTAAQAMLGPDLANLSLLYGRNDRLRRQILEAAFDSLVAASLMVDRKLDLGADESDSAALRELKEQIESLRCELQELLTEHN